MLCFVSAGYTALRFTGGYAIALPPVNKVSPLSRLKKIDYKN
jgi:hypothetical protein